MSNVRVRVKLSFLKGLLLGMKRIWYVRGVIVYACDVARLH